MAASTSGNLGCVLPYNQQPLSFLTTAEREFARIIRFHDVYPGTLAFRLFSYRIYSPV
jgi:hypothetical protein